MELLTLKSFIHHGHKFHLYVYDDVPGIPGGIEVFDANEIISHEKIYRYKDGGSYAGFANQFRYALLFMRGGFWVDMDTVCLRPYNFDQEYVFASQRPGDINNNVIKAPVDAPILEYCLKEIQSMDLDNLKWGVSGPRLMKRAVNKFSLQEFVAQANEFCPVDYWCVNKFIECSAEELFSDVPPGELCSVHLWNEMWERNGLDKDAVYDKNCFYEEVKRLLL